MEVSAEAMSMTENSSRGMRSTPRTSCYLCAAAGPQIYQGVTDRMFSAPGVWNTRRCSSPDCGLLWLDPMPFEDDIGLAYDDYITHQGEFDDQGSDAISRFRRAIKTGYLA